MRSVVQTQRDRLVLIAIALCLFVFGACVPAPTPATSASTITSAPTIIAPALRPTSAPTAAPPPPSTAQPIANALDAVTRALKADDAAVLAPLLLDQVLLAHGPDGNSGGLVKRDDAIAWLTARWSQQRAVTSHDYIEHFVLLEITTQGWANIAPLDNSRIIFHLHRYDAQGQGDALKGQWRIDAILYQ